MKTSGTGSSRKTNNGEIGKQWNISRDREYCATARWPPRSTNWIEGDLGRQVRPGTPSIILQSEGDEGAVHTGVPSVSRTPSMASRPPFVQAAPAPQLQEILDMLLHQQQDVAETRAAERTEQARLREEAAEDRARAQRNAKRALHNLKQN